MNNDNGQMDDGEGPGIQIDVTGPPDSGKTAICTLIANSLEKAGFVNVTVTDQEGDVVEPGEAGTILDLMVAARPELLRQHIRIVENTELEDEENVIELGDVTLRIDPADDTIFNEDLGGAPVLAEIGD